MIKRLIQKVKETQGKPLSPLNPALLNQSDSICFALPVTGYIIVV